MAHTFHYQTGEEVMIGDVVRYPEPFGVGVVELFLEPFGEEAHRWNVPEGGVFMAFGDENHEMNLLLSWPEEEEDLELIRRGTIPCVDPTGGGVE